MGFRGRTFVAECKTPKIAYGSHLNPSQQAITDTEMEQVIDMSGAKMSVRDIASELGISKSAVSRLQAKARAAGRIL